MINIALFQPEIPPNTGNLIRLCANTGFQLHLIHPLGFKLTDKQCQRAGLDYHEWTRVIEHACFDDFIKTINKERLFACSTKGSVNYTKPRFEKNDTFLFGQETRGLPPTVFASLNPDHILRIPMLPHSRSLNLSNAAAIIAFEAWRQIGFCRVD